MTYDEAKAMTEQLRERGKASFSASEKVTIERLYAEVLGKKFRVTSCQRCYHDAVLEIALYLRKHNTMPTIEKKQYTLRAGFIIRAAEFHDGKVFSNANLTDEIAEEYLAKYPHMAKYFATIPEKPVLKPSDALKADGVANYPRKQRKPRKTKITDK